MSIDHKANNEEEKKRIESMGGIVTNDRNGPYRVFSKTEDGPGLAVARTLGDLLGHVVGVSSEPEITYKLLDIDDKFIAIGSDGIWDVMNSAEVVGYLFEKGENVSKEKLPENLVWEARNRWEVINMYRQKISAEKNQQKEQNNANPTKNVTTHTTIYTIDDITAVICFFSPPPDKEQNQNDNDSMKSDQDKK